MRFYDSLGLDFEIIRKEKIYIFSYFIVKNIKIN